MRYIIDTSSWIDYFIENKNGRKAAKIIEDRFSECITIECTIAEIREWCFREDKEFSQAFKSVISLSNIFPLTLSNWIDAAIIKSKIRKKKKNIGLMDCLILAKQKEIRCKIVTSDDDFKGLKNVVFLA